MTQTQNSQTALQAYVARTVAQFPRLSEEQTRGVAALLGGGAK